MGADDKEKPAAHVVNNLFRLLLPPRAIKRNLRNHSSWTAPGIGRAPDVPKTKYLPTI